MSHLSRRPFVASLAFVLLAGLAALLGGCVTQPVEGRDYMAPAPGIKPTATILGAASKDGSFFGGSESAYVLMVDYLTVLNAAESAGKPLLLEAGSHHITCEYRYSNFVSRATFKLNVAPGAAYQLKYETSADSATDRRFCDFWIVDTASGATVGARQRQQVSGGRSKSSSLFRPE
ncbi:MAG: hypothetical protein JSS11_07060 [Verrucomicrobia bacterium]|nr:hypothetical protein [Verrucomicrobiota bacterium]